MFTATQVATQDYVDLRLGRNEVIFQFHLWCNLYPILPNAEEYCYCCSILDACVEAGNVAVGDFYIHPSKLQVSYSPSICKVVDLSHQMLNGAER